MLSDHLVERRYCRYRIDQPVAALQYWDESRTRTIEGRCHSISEGGLGARFSDQLRVGEMVLIQISPTLRVYAVVRNMAGFDHGLEFVLMRGVQRKAMADLCRNHAQRVRMGHDHVHDA